MTVSVTYRQTLKPAAVETPLDLWLFRPAAWGLVRLALPTPLSANGMTALSIAAGLAGAAMMLSPDPWLFRAGAGLGVAYGVLDCADGQLARARGTSSRVGRVLDGMSDYIVGSATGVAVALHLSRQGGWAMGALGAVGVVSVVVQGTLFDHFKNRYLSRARVGYREGDDLDDTLAEVRSLRARGAWATAALLTVYATFLRVQSSMGGARATTPPPTHDPRFADAMRPLARGWAWLGPSTHVLLLALFSWADRLDGYAWLRLVPGNVAMVALWLAWRSRERALSAG